MSTPEASIGQDPRENSENHGMQVGDEFQLEPLLRPMESVTRVDDKHEAIANEEEVDQKQDAVVEKTPLMPIVNFGSAVIIFLGHIVKDIRPA